MQLSSIYMQGVERALGGLSMRHQAIASNIANINTPGYARREVSFEQSLTAALDASQPKAGGAAETMDGMPITSNQPDVMLSWQPVMTQTPSGAQRLDGNQNTVETEMSGMAFNAVKYNALAAVVAKEMQILKSVAQAK